MDRVGGYLGYLALVEDVRAYDDVLIALAGEADAQRMAELEQKAGRGRRTSGDEEYSAGFSEALTPSPSPKLGRGEMAGVV